MAISADERRIIELMVKSTGERELKALTRDLKAVRAAAEQSQQSLGSMGSSLSSMGRAVKGFVGLQIFQEVLQTGQAVIAMAGRAIDEMNELALSIQKVGVAAGDMQKLQFAAALTNVSTEALNKGLTRLAVQIADVSNKSSAGTKWMRELGITAQTEAVPAIKILAAEFAKMPDGLAKAARASQLFGKGVSQEMIPFLNTGAEGLEAMFTEAEKLGLVLSNEALAGADMFNDEMDRLGAVLEANIKKFIGGMFPALITVAQLLTSAESSTVDYASAGAALGAVIVAVTADVVSFGKTLQVYGKAAIAFVSAMGQAIMAFDQLSQGNVESADLYMKAAKLNLDAAAIYWNNAEAIGNAAGRAVNQQYQQNMAEMRRQAALLNGGGGGGEIDTDSGAAGKAKAGKSDAEKEAEAAAKRQAKINQQLIEQTLQMVEAWQKEAEAARDFARELNAVVDPMVNYEAGLKRLNAAQASGILTDRARRAELERLANAMLEAAGAAEGWDKAQQAAQDRREKEREQMEKVRDEWGFIADAMGQATYDILTGSEKISHAIKRMVASIIADLIRVQAMKFIIGLLTGSSNPFLQRVGGFMGSANGNAFSGGGVVSVPTVHAMANGGIGVMGEAGPEAVLPLQRNAAGKLGVAATNMGVTVNNYAGAEIGVRQTPTGIQIDVIRRQLADDIRRGGTNLSAALEQTYRVGRQASAT
jgi:hypothetical protein